MWRRFTVLPPSKQNHIRKLQLRTQAAELTLMLILRVLFRFQIPATGKGTATHPTPAEQRDAHEWIGKPALDRQPAAANVRRLVQDGHPEPVPQSRQQQQQQQLYGLCLDRYQLRGRSHPARQVAAQLHAPGRGALQEAAGTTPPDNARGEQTGMGESL